MRFSGLRSLLLLGLSGVLSSGMPAHGAWPEDEFDGDGIDPAKWTVVYVPHGSNTGAVELHSNCSGSLHTGVYHRDDGQDLAQAYVESLEDEEDTPWTYYTRVKYQTSDDNWSTVHLGFYFLMEDGQQAFLRFDSTGYSWCRVKYGSDSIGAGACLWHKAYYDFKFSWDGVELRAWYREPGRSEWIGNYAIFSSFITYPQKLRIGQVCANCNGGTYRDVNMDAYVCFWTANEPPPDPEGYVEDEFGYTQLDPTKWSAVVRPYGANTGSVEVDGNGHLQVFLRTRDDARAAAGVWAETTHRLPDEPWEYYSGAYFRASPESQWGRTDVDLGFNFEMADGTSIGFVEFDGNTTGCRLKYGTGSGTNYGPRLPDAYWYELKFVWSPDQILRAWYREWGRERWLPEAGYAVFGSTLTYPELLRIGHRDLVSVSSYRDIDMYLYADYWRQSPNELREIGHTSDEFDFPDIDAAKWEVRHRNYAGGSGEIYPDGVGNLRVAAFLRDDGGLASQQWIQARKRLSDDPWAYYTRASFGVSGHAHGINRTDISLGYRLRTVEGKEAWLELDGSTTGCRLKYGNTALGDVSGKIWNQWWPIELKFDWDGSALRAWYREAGRAAWLGNFNLYGSTTDWPELVKIGQPRVKRPSTYRDVNEYLYVDYWMLDDEPIPQPEDELTDEFTLASIDPALWRTYDRGFSGSSTGSVTAPGEYLRFQLTSVDDGGPRWLGWVSAVDRIPEAPWTCETRIKFSASAENRSDIDLGVHFMLSNGRSASCVFDSQSGMRLKYGIESSVAWWSLTNGPSLTPGVWYQLRFSWDGECLRADYRLSDEDPWTGDIQLACDVGAYPERVRLGQINWRNPSTYHDVTAQLLVDYIRLHLSFVMGDYDEDNDVDLDDYAVLADCLNGPDMPPDPPPPITVQECLDVFDFDGDADVDLPDASSFQIAFTGP